jgi:hypothetical protein
MLSDGVAGETAKCTIMVQLMVSNMERIYHSPNFTNSEVLGETAHKKLLQNFDSRYGGQNSLVLIEEGAGLQEPRFSMISCRRS